MSKIGRNPIDLVSEVNVTFNGQEVLIKGQKGEGKVNLPKAIKAEVKENKLFLTTSASDKKNRAMHGLVRTLISNYIVGVNKPWEKILEIHGVGFRAKMEGKNVVFNLGFSHPVNFTTPADVTVAVNGNKIVVSGVNKQRVGEVAATIKRIRIPDKYKGKGLRYQGEVLKLKPGKKAKTAG